ncbi:hypothetical protein GCM10023093_15430 [Nemorincola caseinilytica]|uniref:DUF2029 domain-containing protein n=1 Tax=Nemorincola caseinilytica TaxID=2054315 RepID=A0ABP8NDN7_9BACT
MLNEYVLVFVFCLAAVHGPAFSLMDNFDLAGCVDCKTYLGLAQLDLDQSPIRRYRPIVPLLAGCINYVFGGVFKVLQPTSFNGDFGLSFSFYLVNCVLLSLWGVVIYRFGKAYGLRQLYALLGTLVMLTCRWTPYIAGTPLADSVYCLALGLALLGIKEGNERMLLASILIGPFAKESYLLMAPIVFFFGKRKGRLTLYLALSGALVFGFRYLYDMAAGTPPGSGLAADVDHVNYIADNTRRLLSFHGAYDVLSNMGLWLLLPIIALVTVPGAGRELRVRIEPYMICFLLVIVLHMVLSSSFERMFYLSMPVLCMLTGVSIQLIGDKWVFTRK